MFSTEELKVMAEALLDARDRDDKAYKVADHYVTLTNGTSSADRVALAKKEVLEFEGCLRELAEKHPGENGNRQPAEMAVCLIDYLQDNKKI